MVLKKIDTNVTEKQFREIWQRSEVVGKTFFAENGMKVRVVYPGRPNDRQGADFRDAVILTETELRTGDVEFHLRSSDWRGHHHHLDPVYNRVVLHVVRQHNTRKGTVLQNGIEIPIVVLDDNFSVLSVGGKIPLRKRNSTGMTCMNFTGNGGSKVFGDCLDRAGRTRFLQKTGRFSSEIDDIGPDESLYRGIMEALGYSGNKDSFLELARKIPLAQLERKKDSGIQDENYLFELLLLLFGTAGFLKEEYRERLCSAGLDGNLVKQMIRTGMSIDMNSALLPGNWRLFRIRPCNSPFRRLFAMSYLLLKYREKGLLRSMLDLIDSVPELIKPRELERELVVCEGGISYLGKSRAAEIIVNVVLPFTFAFGNNNNRPDLSEKALTLYTVYPGLEMNSLIRHMTGQLSLDKAVVNTAIRQQGMIHIYKNLCTQGRCHECELSEF